MSRLWLVFPWVGFTILIFMDDLSQMSIFKSKRRDDICLIDPKFLRCVGGVETHGFEFARHFLNAEQFRIGSIISRDVVEDGIPVKCKNKILEGKTIRKLSFNLEEDANLILKNSSKYTAIYFFNNPNWLPVVPMLRSYRPDAKIIVRSGGNDIVAGWIFNENDSTSDLQTNQVELVNIINEYVDTLIVNSSYSFNRMVSLGISKGKLKILKGGVNCEIFYPLTKKSPNINIGLCARLVKFKGVEYSIKVIDNLLKKNHNVKFLIAGDGPEMDNLVKLSKNLHLSKNVKFLGAIEYLKVPMFLRQLDIFLHMPIHLLKKERGASYIHTETMGRSLCEASATGLPIVVTDVGGTSEIVCNNKTGFVVNEFDVQAASQAALTLIENEELRKTMGVEARKLAIGKLDWSHMFLQYRKLFEK